MKAYKYFGEHDARLIDADYPVIQGDDEVILKITLSTICGSDAGLLELETGSSFLTNPGTTIGHEFVGEIVEVGPGVRGLKIGDRVAGNAAPACGTCAYCKEGRYDLCQAEDLEKYPGFVTDGCQAEYMRYPMASTNLHLIPDNVTDEQALFVGDILATGYTGAALAEISEGDDVAVMGCGPVALCAMKCAQLFDPAQVIAVGGVADALNLALDNDLCDAVVNYRECDTQQALSDLTDGRMPDRIIVAKGGGETLAEAVKLVRPGGIVVSVGASQDIAPIDYYDLVGKSKTVKGGFCNTAYAEEMLQRIAEGRLDMTYLITHRFPLNDIDEAYDTFVNKKDGCIKVAITPYEH